MAEQTTVPQAARPRTYTDEYRRQVVGMVTSTGRTAMSVATELGIHHTLISRWIRRYGRTGQAPTLPAAPTSQLKPVLVSPSQNVGNWCGDGRRGGKANEPFFACMLLGTMPLTSANDRGKPMPLSKTLVQRGGCLGSERAAIQLLGLHALQTSLLPSSPHCEGALPRPELAGLRSRAAAPR